MSLRLYSLVLLVVAVATVFVMDAAYGRARVDKGVFYFPGGATSHTLTVALRDVDPTTGAEVSRRILTTGLLPRGCMRLPLVFSPRVYYTYDIYAHYTAELWAGPPTYNSALTESDCSEIR